MNKRQSKKEHLLASGMEVMKLRGYQGTSVKDIVDVAGVPKGSFYNYFASKEAFVLEAIEKAASSSYANAEKTLLNTAKPPLERIVDFFQSGIDQACDSEFKHGCFLGNLTQEMSDTSDPIRLKLKAALNRVTALIAEVVEEVHPKQEGDASELQPFIVAEFLFNAWEGALMRAKATKNREPFDAFLTMTRYILK
ncbi:TetR/AcrR family transcriptional regulator [Teredinibacter sp. KSP-S5-2]|uniref:TetR/AcrR family transcriptional regulator n=1 Tax=Teredinibacter sp. KSP-S5-2 TaxID=3034506 RepID=UPI002934B2E1|nr:TetR family transcriptional regulator C-terminal domain-containing protein [Teredinibacter sp. KSP-S5-2]WNO09303.1 TetR family transcriptional regulator C-terminal domain-containing protein [Teredinibacter sp. KSP-S5-2]